MITPVAALITGTLTLIAGAAYSNTVTLGSLVVGLFVALATVISMVYGVRYRTSYQVAAARAEQLDAWLREALDRETRQGARLNETLEQLSATQDTVTKLEALPNLERIVRLMSETAERQEQHAQKRLEVGIGAMRDHFEKRFEAMEERAQDRHESQLAVAARLVAQLERLERAA